MQGLGLAIMDQALPWALPYGHNFEIFITIFHVWHENYRNIMDHWKYEQCSNKLWPDTVICIIVAWNLFSGCQQRLMRVFCVQFNAMMDTLPILQLRRILSLNFFIVLLSIIQAPSNTTFGSSINYVNNFKGGVRSEIFWQLLTVRQKLTSTIWFLKGYFCNAF
jgi:hypothetical protein